MGPPDMSRAPGGAKPASILTCCTACWIRAWWSELSSTPMAAASGSLPFLRRFLAGLGAMPGSVLGLTAVLRATSRKVTSESSGGPQSPLRWSRSFFSPW